MASALVNIAVEKFGGMILEKMNEEASLVLNFREDFEWLNKKLTMIRDYTRDADAQGAPSVKSWLLDFAEIAWDAEDILEEFAVESKDTDNEIPQSSCIGAFSRSQLVLRRKMARRIKDLKDRMRSIMEEAKELNLVRDLTRSEQPSTSTSQNLKWRGSSVTDRDSRPVAIESKVEDVLGLLRDPPAPSVIAVVGMGGLGKTFLMQNVFNRAKNMYKIAIWLSISQTYSPKKLQAALALEIKGLDEVVNDRVDEVKAKELIHGRLEGTASLIVLDDVWRATGEDDLISALGLPAGNNSQCKIVVTTRNRDVCRSMNAWVYELQPLSEEESWNLFCAFAFPDCQQNQPPHHLEGIARQIVGKCARLPLAVKTVAASLADKKVWDWISKLRQLRSASSTDDSIMPILKLSYDSLPAHLKPCFAYLSFFPEDEWIDSQYLINLWVAEGYVPQGEDQLDIGWSYLCHLQSLFGRECREKV